MKSVRTIRKVFGLTQLEFASMLGVSRSLLSMAERHERHLPSQALLKLAEIEKHRNGNKTKMPDEQFSKGIEHESKKIRKRLMKLNLAITSARMKLVQLQCHHNGVMLQQLQFTQPLPVSIKFRNKRKLNVCGHEVQFLIEAKILGMEAERDALQQKLL